MGIIEELTKQRFGEERKEIGAETKPSAPLAITATKSLLMRLAEIIEQIQQLKEAGTRMLIPLSEALDQTAEIILQMRPATEIDAKMWKEHIRDLGQGIAVLDEYLPLLLSTNKDAVKDVIDAISKIFTILELYYPTTPVPVAKAEPSLQKRSLTEKATALRSILLRLFGLLVDAEEKKAEMLDVRNKAVALLTHLATHLEELHADKEIAAELEGLKDKLVKISHKALSVEDIRKAKDVIVNLINKIATHFRLEPEGVVEALTKARKGKGKGVAAAIRKIEEGARNLKAGKGEEAFEDFAAAKFYLIDEDAYREPLLNTLDELMDMAWKVMQGEEKGKKIEVKSGKVDELTKRALRLIASPRGERARPPVRVKTARDARLWEAAKRIVEDNYPEVEVDSDRYWALVSRIFTRMRLRLGGLPEREVEKIVEELREKEGKLPPAGEGAKGKEKIEELKRKVREQLLKALYSLGRSL